MNSRYSRWRSLLVTLLLGCAMLAFSLWLLAFPDVSGTLPVGIGRVNAMESQPLAKDQSRPAATFLAVDRPVSHGPKPAVYLEDYTGAIEASALSAAMAGTFNYAWLSPHAADTQSVAWGDMDGDGDLDLVAGSHSGQVNRVYRNDGNGKFTDVTDGDLLQQTDDTISVAWGDMEGDGDLDIAVGNTGGQANRIYMNNGAGSFVDITGGDLALDFDDTRSIAWGDIDGDGALDLAVGNHSSQANRIYLNAGNGNFTDVTNGDLAQDVDDTVSIALGDLDGDDDLDLAVGNSGGQINKVYRNDGGGIFSDITAGDLLIHVDDTKCAVLGDINGDGLLDIVTGNDGQNRIYRNDGGGSFTDITDGDLQIDKDFTLGITLGDVNGDGHVDVVAANTNLEPNKIYRNDGGGTFTNITSGDLATDSHWTSSIALGDIDNDGDLDLAVGNDQDYVDQVYRNVGGSGFYEITDGDLLQATDTTWSIAWGDVDGDGDLDLAAGNGSGDTSKVYRNDGDGKFTDISDGDLLLNQDLTWSMAWGDVDGDGDLDLAAGNGSGDTSKVYRNWGGGIFTDITTGDLAMDIDSTHSLVWGDFDGDGDLDLAAGNDQQTNKIYRNDGNGAFIDVTGGDMLVDVDATRSVAWGDMDGDGDVDLAVGNFGQNKVYRNEGDGIFTDITGGDLKLDSDKTTSLAWGDIDGDGKPDLVAGNSNLFGHVNKVYRNEGDGRFVDITKGDLALELDDTTSVALGDLDGDGDLDLATGNISVVGAVNKVYRNDGSGNFVNISGGDLLSDSDPTLAIALGDVDGDGDVDLAVGNSGQNKVYQSAIQGGASVLPDNVLYLGATSPYTATANFYAASVILDSPIITIPYSLFDPEGDPVGQIRARYSINGGGTWVTATSAPGTDITNLVTFGRALQFDGLDDIVTVPNSPQINTITRTKMTVMAWFKVTDPSDLSSKQVIYEQGGRNNGLNLYVYDGQLYGGAWSEELGWGQGTYLTAEIDDSQWHHAALVLSGTTTMNQDVLQLYLDGQLVGVGEGTALPPHIGNIGIGAVAGTTQFHDGDVSGLAHGFGGLIDEVQIWLSAFTTEHIEFWRMRKTANLHRKDLAAYWRFNEDAGDFANDASVYGNDGTLGGGTAALKPARRVAGQPYTFQWDTFASGFFGQSDNVVFRLEAIAQTSDNSASGIYPYPNAVAGPFQRAGASSTTYPFRVRGTQVRVISGTEPAVGALVYRLAENEGLAEPMANPQTGLPWRTDSNGYLQGKGELRPGDHIMALYPARDIVSLGITFTNKISVFYTSAAVTAEGPAMAEVTQGGVQELSVSSNNPLLLLNLDVALEWDARKNPEYLDQLEADLNRTSEIFYDLTNGRFALGNIRLFQAGDRLHEADIVILASNEQRPSAALGGIVNTAVSDTLKTGESVPLAFLPGQVRMGATWNRYGEPGGTLGEDWPRALAHELGHYALFELDNYIGIEGDSLIATDCQGSAMTDAYRQDYSELLARDLANADGYYWAKPDNPDVNCFKTLAENTTGRSDWQTLLTFYPMLTGTTNVTGSGTGPLDLPLAVTNIEPQPVSKADNTFAVPLIYLEDSSGGALALQPGKAQAYLFATQNTADATDDVLIHLGTPNGPLVRARGAAPGDRFCVFDSSLRNRPRAGCLENLQPLASTLQLEEVSAWNPQIEVTPVNSTTLAVTVTQPGVAGPLMVQILPAYRPTTTVQALTAGLMPIGGDRYAAQLQFPMTVLYGDVRVWQEGSDPLREMIRPFLFTVGWDGNAFLSWGGNAFLSWDGNAFLSWDGNAFLSWGGNAFLSWGGNAFLSWGGNAFSAWSAPVSAPDGQVKIFNVNDVLGLSPPAKLESLSEPPGLPPWLAPIGRAYNYQIGEGELASLAIQFQYLTRDMGNINENDLHIYYSADQGQNWRQLPTTRDIARNLASAHMPGEGLYALVATIELPAFYVGWNSFGYPVRQSRPVTEALASIAGDYTALASYDPVGGWQSYYPDVEPPFVGLVNDLFELEFSRAYWLYATRAITGYLLPDVGATQLAEARRTTGGELQLPPATYYGWVHPTPDFTPQVGMMVEARIDGNLCGQSSIVSLDGQLAYRILVEAENLTGSANGCGTLDRQVTFWADGQEMGIPRAWDNRRAWFRMLPGETALSYLPLLAK